MHEYLAVAHFMVADGDVPGRDLWWRGRGRQAGSCSGPALSLWGVGFSGPRSLNCEAGRPGWDQGSPSSLSDPTVGPESDLSETGEATAPGQATLGPVSACLESRLLNTALSCTPSCLAPLPSCQVKALPQCPVSPLPPEEYLCAFSDTDTICT